MVTLLHIKMGVEGTKNDRWNTQMYGHNLLDVRIKEIEPIFDYTPVRFSEPEGLFESCVWSPGLLEGMCDRAE